MLRSLINASTVRAESLIALSIVNLINDSFLALFETSWKQLGKKVYARSNALKNYF
jgi:hypothetical protein